MLEENIIYLSVAIEGDLAVSFDACKEKAGIKSNTEFLRFLIAKALSTFSAQ